MKEDLAFWGIDELSLQACCSLKYYSQISSCQSELEEERNKRYGFHLCTTTRFSIHSGINIFLKLLGSFIIHDNDLDNCPYCVNYWLPGMLRIRETETRTLENLSLGELERCSGTSHPIWRRYLYPKRQKHGPSALRCRPWIR